MAGNTLVSKKGKVKDFPYKVPIQMVQNRCPWYLGHSIKSRAHPAPFAALSFLDSKHNPQPTAP